MFYPSYFVAAATEITVKIYYNNGTESRRNLEE
jgi:hypothetical protein